MGAEVCLFAALFGFVVQAAIALASPIPRIAVQPVAKP